jgi:hypothetical protein
MRFAIALAVLLSSSLAFAQSAADVSTARDLFREGMELRAAGHLAEALAKLKAAHELYETPPSALELARTQIDLGRLSEGYETLVSIDRIPSAKDSERSKQARVEAKDLETKTKARIPTLRIDVKGAAASVTLDGAVVSSALFGIARKIDPGKHVVGCDAKRIEIDVPEGQAISVPCESSSSSSDVQVLGAVGGVVGPLPSQPPRGNRFSVLYKFLPPKADERWTLHARGGSLTCALPCEQWIGEHSGAYLMRAPSTDDSEPRRVDVSEMLPATIGSTVTARPHAGKGSPGVGFIGGVLAALGVLGVIGGPITLVVGLAELKDTNATGHDTAIVGGIMTGVSAAFLAVGILLGNNNYPARIDYVVGP